MLIYYKCTYKQRKTLAVFTRYFSTGFFLCENRALCKLKCWFVCFLMFVAGFHHQMLTPPQVNNPAGGRQEKKLQDHQLLQTRANHAEQWRRVCYSIFLLKNYSGAVTFLNSSLAVNFSGLCHGKFSSSPFWFSFFCWNWRSTHSFHSSKLLKWMA